MNDATDQQSCPVWCNGEHTGTVDPLGGGWFHDSSRDVLELVDDGPVSIGVSRYVNEGGTVDRDMVELRATRSERFTPGEARRFADMLYMAADIAASTTL